MSGTYRVMMSLSKLRPLITEEVELTISIALTGSGIGVLPSTVTPPKYTTVQIEQRGRGRLGMGRELVFDGSTRELRVRINPQLPGALELRATSNFRDPRPTILRPAAVTGRLPSIYIAPVLPTPAAGACVRFPPTTPPTVTRETWRNWHGNIARSLRVTRPRGVAEIRAAIQAAEAAGERVGLAGSGWSFSHCAVHDDTSLVISPGATPARITDVLTSALRFDLRDDAEAFIHVPAAMRIHELNCLLASRGRAMPTLGGSRGQTIAGVLSTGVHGSDVDLAPIADAVCAIHLVGPGGQEWWIEPETDSITMPLQMQRNRDAGRGSYCRHMRIVYSDDLFNSVLVSMGCAGVIHSVVLKTVPAYELVTSTREISWAEGRDYINGRIVPGVALPRYAEINLIPGDGACVLVERRLPRIGERVVETPPAAPLDMCAIAVAAGLMGPGAFGLFFAAIGDYIRRVSEDVARDLWWDGLLPGLGTYLAGKTAAEGLDTLVEMHEALGRLALATIDPSDDENIARLLPVAVNLIWKIGFFVIQGREIIDQFQRLVTSETRPVGVKRQASYVAMTGQPACPESDTAVHSAMERLVESFEYAVPADRAVAFAERVRAIVDELRRGPDALIVNINMRFTRASRALLAMQQFDRTCHFEIYTFRGMDGNAAFHRRLFELAREFDAIPHWGQLHQRSPDLGRLFGRKLAIWQWAMNLIATAGIGTPNLFWSRFARERGLLDFEPSPVRLHPDATRWLMESSRSWLGILAPLPDD